MRLRPANVGGDGCISRGRGAGRTDKGLGVRAREGREIVLVGTHKKAVAEVKGFLVARIVGGDLQRLRRFRVVLTSKSPSVTAPATPGTARAAPRSSRISARLTGIDVLCRRLMAIMGAIQAGG
jgi:hypothetical protein